MIGRYRATGSLKGWIVLKNDDPKAIYQYTAQQEEFLIQEITPIIIDA